MATIKQRENGGWQAKVRRKGWPAQSRTFDQKTDAEKWARAVEHEMDQGVFTSASDAERTTLGDLIIRFEQEFAPHHYRVREDQKEAWRFQCARLSEALGAYSLAAIDQKTVAKYRDDRLAGEKRQAVSASTVRKELYMLSKVLRFAEAECGISLPRGNPVEKIRKPSDGKSRNRRLSDEQWAALERECKKSRNPWIAAALTLAVESAMRQGELLNLSWKDVDTKRSLALLLNPEKIKTDPRAVPLASRAMAVLDSLPRSTTGKVFPLERLTLYHAFVAARKRAGISDYTWHDLRHEALSRLAERGDLSVLELAAISGHKTLQVLKRYTHLQASKLAEKLG